MGMNFLTSTEEKKDVGLREGFSVAVRNITNLYSVAFNIFFRGQGIISDNRCMDYYCYYH